MELATTPDIYCASIEGTVYVDYIPPIDTGSGLKCPCNGCSHTYKSKTSFQAHVRSRTHQRWLSHLTAEGENYCKEAIEGRDTIRTQKKIISDLSQKLLVLGQQHLALNQRNADLSFRLTTLQVGSIPLSPVDDLISFE